MAYGLKYRSNFYNYFGRLVSVQISKEDYTGDVTDVRTSEVTMEVNYQDDNTPVIGTGVKVVVIADEDDMTYLEDLLLSYEREFICVIEHDSEVVFRGYSLCDLNERQLLPYAQVTLQFTNYLHRLSEHYPSSLKDKTQSVSVMRLVTDLMNMTDLDLPLYVNSTLFEVDMDNDATDTFLPQVFVQCFQFYTSSFKYDALYDAINKALHPFSAYIYYYKDQWIIERQEDITRTGNWVKYTGGSTSSESSLQMTIHKQSGDFEYVGGSQIIEYDSGLRTLILQLHDKKLDSMVFNDYTEDMSPINFSHASFSDYPADELTYRTWYRHSSVSIDEVLTDFKHMDKCLKYTASAYYQGLYYYFRIQFNQLESDTPTVLSVRFKTAVEYISEEWDSVSSHFLLRMCEGTYDGYWVISSSTISLITMGVGGEYYCDFDNTWRSTVRPLIILFPSEPDSNVYKSADPITFLANWRVTTVSSGEQTGEFTHETTFNLSESYVAVFSKYTDGSYTIYENMYDLLEIDSSVGKFIQGFHIVFVPPWYFDEKNTIFDRNRYGMFSTSYIGDIAVTVQSEPIDNRIEYQLHEDFVKTQEIDLYLFDLDNLNYANGLMIRDEWSGSGGDSEFEDFTKAWTSENSVSACPLYEVFAKCKFRKYGRTIHRLKSRILYDGALKPFTIITDDNVPSETSSGGNMIFLLNGYTWDLYKGEYSIMAEEYTEAEVVVDGVTYDSEGNAILSTPDTPTNFSAAICGTYRTKAVCVSWDPVGGQISGYKLYRKPLWNEIYGWRDLYQEIYRGTETEFRDYDDHFRRDPPGTLTYKVCAYNDAGDSAFTSEENVSW